MNQVTFSGRQQVLLRSGLQTDDVYEIQWVSAKGRPVNRIKNFEDDEVPKGMQPADLWNPELD